MGRDYVYLIPIGAARGDAHLQLLADVEDLVAHLLHLLHRLAISIDADCCGCNK